MTGLPAFKVEIDADPDTTGLFVLDTSSLDGTDTLAETVRYVAIPADDVRTISTKRGRSRDDQANEVGVMTLELDAWSGDYDPDNPATPYQLGGELLLKQGMLVRASATIGGVDHYLFTGTLDTTAAGYGHEPSMVWTCVDVLARLGQASFPPSSDFVRGGDTSEERAVWLLQYDPALVDAIITPAGRTLVATQGGGTVLSNLEDVARSEWGRVYADRDGALVVTQHADDYWHTVDLTISDSGTSGGDPVYGATYPDVYPGLGVLSPDDLTVEPGLVQVINKAILTRPVSTAAVEGEPEPAETKFTAEDAASVDLYGRRTQSAQILLSSDAEAQELADYLASHRAIPAARLTSVSTSLGGEPNVAQAAAADLELGAWVLVQRTTPDGRNLSWQVSAEGIEHTSTTTGWRLTLATVPLDLGVLFGTPDWFVLDTSALDGPDFLGAS